MRKITAAAALLCVLSGAASAQQAVRYLGPASAEVDVILWFHRMTGNAKGECTRLWPEHTEKEAACIERQEAAGTILLDRFLDAPIASPPRIFILECLDQHSVGVGMKPFNTLLIPNFPRVLDCTEAKLAAHREQWSR
ncbi:MAG: hypothetical protein Kow00114_36030 [Kiloniellaceae bacterium]